MLILTVLISVNVSQAKPGKWRVYQDCELIESKANDGDSFHVRCKKRHYIFRLYFVDTPETNKKLEQRIAEQAEYWGLSSKESIALGKQSIKFTRKWLKKGFTIYTKLVDARGASSRKRYYAMVEVDGEYLSEALVKAGLARIYGYTTELPDGVSSRIYSGRLRKAERAAKKNKLGGWARKLTRVEKLRARMDLPE